jgi:hypothetical protein
MFPPPSIEDPDRENIFELIYSPGGTRNSEVAVNKRRPISLKYLYPDKDIEFQIIGERIKSVQEQNK